MKQLKPPKGVKPPKHKESHTANTMYGMGDYYGSGVKAKIGKLRGDTVGIRPATRKQLKTPPKSFA